jgi:hypothetical protein
MVFSFSALALEDNALAFDGELLQLSERLRFGSDSGSSAD